MKLKILPCPHCGGEASLVSKYNQALNSYFVFVRCNICMAQSKACRTYSDPEATNWEHRSCVHTVAAWNMRVQQENEPDEADTEKHP